MLKHLPERDSSQETWNGYLADYVPYLSNVPSPYRRDLLQLLGGLPDRSINTLFQQGYLKWPVSRLDRNRQLSIRNIVKGILASPPAGDIQEIVRKSTEAALATANAGFVIIDIPKSESQFLAYFVSLPSSRNPMLIPLVGISSNEKVPIDSKAIESQLRSLVDEKSCGELPDKPARD